MIYFVRLICFILIGAIAGWLYSQVIGLLYGILICLTYKHIEPYLEYHYNKIFSSPPPRRY